MIDPRRQLFRDPHPRRAPRLVPAATLLVIAGRIAYEHATTATSVFMAFTRRAVP